MYNKNTINLKDHNIAPNYGIFMHARLLAIVNTPVNEGAFKPVGFN